MITRRGFAPDSSLLLGAAALLSLALLAAALWASSLGSSASLPFSSGGAASAGEGDAGARIEHNYGRLPLAFEANTGITDESVDFLSRGPGYSLFLSPTEATLALPRGESGGIALRMRLQGADPTATAVGEQRLPGSVNYLRGSDRSEWETAVPTYAGVSYANVYDGIDVRYYGNQRQLEYDFELAADADPRQIALRFDGAREVSVAANGDLLLSLPGGTLRERAPVAYQRIGGERHRVDARYIVDGHRASFALGHYDRSRPLTIDPLVLAYSTYLDATLGFGIAVDTSGAAYVTGEVYESDFPTTPGAFDTTFAGTGTVADAFVTKLAPDGGSLVYSTYLGSGEFDSGSGIAVDSTGSAYVAGFTASDDFPTTPGAFDETSGGGNAFVTKLTPNGQDLAYSTFLGGAFGSETAHAIGLDSSGSAYVTGETFSDDFPTTPGALDTTFAGTPASPDAFVTKVAPSGGSLAYSTYLGGSGDDRGQGMAVERVGSTGRAHITGATESSNFPTGVISFDTTYNGGGDAFATKLSESGGSGFYSTYLGGGAEDEGLAVAADSAGNTYVTGRTFSSGFPTTPGALDSSFGGGNGDAFVTKLPANGIDLTYSTFLGGDAYDRGLGIAVDSAGSAYVAGGTLSTDFPTTPGGLDGTAGAFMSRFSPDGETLADSTIFATANDEAHGIALGSSGAAYVSGYTSGGFPTTPGAFDTTNDGSVDVFVSKVAVQATTVLNARPMLLDGGVLGLRFGVLRAVLTESESGDPVPGKTIVFSSGGEELCQATTNAAGVAECRLRLDQALLAILGGRYTASFAGDEGFVASSDTAGLL